jgi:mRNA interferase MazF
VSARRWDLAWAGLDPTRGHEQAGRRPVLVFCNDAIAAPIGLATVLPLTTWKQGRRVYPTEVLLPAGAGGLAVASLVLAHQIRTISAERLVAPPLGALTDAALRDAVVRAVRLWLDLADSGS